MKDDRDQIDYGWNEKENPNGEPFEPFDENNSEDYHNPEPTQGEQDAQERNGLRFIYQFVSHKTGDRSQPFVGNWDSLHDAILNQEEENKDVEDEDYILVVCMLDSDDGVKIPGTPLMTTKTFCKWMDFQRVEEETE